MDGATAITLLKQRCARFSGTSLDAYVLQELQAAQVRLEHEPQPFWFQRKSIALADSYLAVNDPELAVPSDFIMECDDSALRVSETATSTRYPLDKMDHDVMEDTYDEYGTRPKAYALDGDSFFFRPIIEDMTATTWRIHLRYFSSLTLIADDSNTNGWLTHCPDLLISEAGIWIANNYLKNTAAAQMFQATITSERNRLHDFQTARDEANNERHDED